MSEKLSTQPYKGTRDFYPQEMRLRNWFFGVMRRVLETAAFEEYNGPMLESLELYAAKSGEEIATKQTYNFVDRGDRRLALRPEMTPTVARMVAGKLNDLVFPLKWFSIPNMYRYEAPQRGRLREFWQLNVDIFGCDTYEADLDCITSAIEIMRAFGADETMFTVHINNRRFFNDVLAAITGTDGDGAKAVSKVIDRRGKVANLFCKAYEKASLLTATEENVRCWTEGTRMTLEELQDTVKESREIAQVFAAIADIIEQKILPADWRNTGPAEDIPCEVAS